MLPKGVLSLRDEAARRSRTSARTMLADLGIPDEVLDYIALKPPLRRARHQARARGLGHRAPAAGDLRGQAVGLLGAPPRPGPVQGPLVRGRRQRQDRGHHRRARRASAGGRAQDRRGRRHPDPRRALGGRSCEEAKAEIEAHRRHRLRLHLRPLRLRRDRRARREGPRRPRLDRHPRQQRGPLDPPLGGGSPTTASTTTSARASSTTSARSS